MRVICENCGGTDWTAIALGLLGVVIGVGALIYAAKASRIAARTLNLAEAQHELERRQFDQEQADRAEHAKFNLSACMVTRAGPVAGDVHTVNRERPMIMLRIDLENIGSRGAGVTTVRLLTPVDGLRAMWWCGPNRERLPGLDHATEAHEVAEPSDDPRAAMLLSRQLESVPRRRPVVLYAQLLLEDLRAGSSVNRPVRVEVLADELPDDVPEAIVEKVFSIVRSPLSS